METLLWTSKILSMLFILFMFHCLGDYPLQGEYLATEKYKSKYILICHCSIYTLVIMLGFIFLEYIGMIENVKKVYGLIIFAVYLSHFWIDEETISANKTYKDENGKPDRFFFYLDQAAHVVVLLVLLIAHDYML